MRILLVSEDLPARQLGGAGKHAVLLGNALLAAGHDVAMLGCVPAAGVDVDHGFRGPLHARIDLAGTGWKERRLGAYLPMRLPHMARRVWRAIRSLDGSWDVIHYHGHLPMLGAIVPAAINFVHTLHDQGGECITRSRFRNGDACAERDAAACAGCATARPNAWQTAVSAYTVRRYRALAVEAFTRHQVICVSRFVEHRLREVLGPDLPLRTRVVHNFTDAAQVRKLALDQASAPPPSDRGALRKPTVFMAGRIDRHKGFGVLLDAMTPAWFAESRLRIAGDGPELDDLRARYAPRGVAFLGWQGLGAILSETAAADLCVVPSIWEEPCATTILEALTVGKRVLALARGGTPELSPYQRFAGQLQLFPDIPSLARALAGESFAAPPVDLEAGESADIGDRLPEILAVYRRAMAAPEDNQRSTA